MDTHAAFKLYFERKRQSSPGFSLRALARRLKVSPSFISRILSGKKPIPSALREPLARALDIEPELLTSPAPRKRAKPSVVNPEVEGWSLADTAAYQILRNWYYIAILELTTLKDFDGRPETISRRLKLAPQTTDVALRELVGLKLLKLTDGKYSKTDAKLRFTSAKSSHLIRKFHDDLLQKSQQELRTALAEEDFQKRLITGITVSATPESVQAAKRKLAACLHEIANDLTAQPGTDVYHLAAQLFPLTKC